MSDIKYIEESIKAFRVNNPDATVQDIVAHATTFSGLCKITFEEPSSLVVMACGCIDPLVIDLSKSAGTSQSG